MRAPGGPRLLLRRLREVMAEPVTAQARLDRIVVLIASNMVAEVCSLYVVARRRRDGAVRHRRPQPRSRPSDDDGARRGPRRPDRLAAPSRWRSPTRITIRPSPTSPRPGEEIYQSFLGVPVLRSGATIGVLVVQNRARRTYSEEEVEALQTTAMLLAEMIASGELQAIADARRADRGAQSARDQGRRHRRRARARPCRAAPAARRGVEDRRRRRQFGARSGSTRRSARCAPRSTS